MAYDYKELVEFIEKFKNVNAGDAIKNWGGNQKAWQLWFRKNPDNYGYTLSVKKEKKEKKENNKEQQHYNLWVSLTDSGLEYKTHELEKGEIIPCKELISLPDEKGDITAFVQDNIYISPLLNLLKNEGIKSGQKTCNEDKINYFTKVTGVQEFLYLEANRLYIRIAEKGVECKVLGREKSIFYTWKTLISLENLTKSSPEPLLEDIMSKSPNRGKLLFGGDPKARGESYEGSLTLMTLLFLLENIQKSLISITSEQKSIKQKIKKLQNEVIHKNEDSLYTHVENKENEKNCEIDKEKHIDEPTEVELHQQEQHLNVIINQLREYKDISEYLAKILIRFMDSHANIKRDDLLGVIGKIKNKLPQLLLDVDQIKKLSEEKESQNIFNKVVFVNDKKKSKNSFSNEIKEKDKIVENKNIVEEKNGSTLYLKEVPYGFFPVFKDDSFPLPDKVTKDAIYIKEDGQYKVFRNKQEYEGNLFKGDHVDNAIQTNNLTLRIEDSKFQTSVLNVLAKRSEVSIIQAYWYEGEKRIVQDIDYEGWQELQKNIKPDEIVYREWWGSDYTLQTMPISLKVNLNKQGENIEQTNKKTIYINEQNGDYVTYIDGKQHLGSLHTGQFSDPQLDLTNLKGKLSNNKFKQQVFAIVAKQTHDPKPFQQIQSTVSKQFQPQTLCPKFYKDLLGIENTEGLPKSTKMSIKKLLAGLFVVLVGVAAGAIATVATSGNFYAGAAVGLFAAGMTYNALKEKGVFKDANTVETATPPPTIAPK